MAVQQEEQKRKQYNQKNRSQSRPNVMQDPSKKRLRNIVKSCENDTYLKTGKTVWKWDLISQTVMKRNN